MFPLILAMIAFILFTRGIKKVPVGEVWMVQRLGHPHRKIESGIHFLIPYIDRIGEKLSPNRENPSAPHNETRNT